ncbi:helix-turn-helix transcriptional regulator [Pseudofrankia sp. BMG5.36]|uniref:helix-turn-helix domain-containing protein n=1 Tax=Pseudofrankia sp. BMG5.36 TaxID=1834512 RepID=UPI0008DA6034|nr:helix-turn-helix transcriptional regulator [Pseudofrankia sp. BMG5.36]OHV48904.1 transcriptional regulator [Pseudofrankia sp. BMG5.36]
MDLELVAMAERIRQAVSTARLTQRALAQATGISQPTLSRIMTGERAAKMPEIIAIADATGHTVAELTGVGSVADRVQCAARATGEAEMAEMRQELLHFLDLDAYLDDQGIPPLPVVP